MEFTGEMMHTPETIRRLSDLQYRAFRPGLRLIWLLMGGGCVIFAAQHSDNVLLFCLLMLPGCGLLLNQNLPAAHRADKLVAAAQTLMNARKIVIFGLGGSAAVAMDLHHKLLRLGLDASVYTDPHLQVIACNYLDDRDAVFAVSHSGSSRCIVDSTQVAKKRGAKVISLTSAGKNPLSKLANVSLTTNSRETKYRVVSIASRVAALTIADSIYTFIAMRTAGARSLQIEKSMEKLKY